MVKGLQIYHRLRKPGFEEIGATADFCQQINNMFDALNRGKSQGVQLDSADYEVRFQLLILRLVDETLAQKENIWRAICMLKLNYYDLL